MASSRSSSAADLAHRGAVVAGTGALFVVGALIDTYAIINVPGAARLPATSEGTVTITPAGAGLFLLVLVAWVSVFWVRRAPVVPLIAGGVLAAVGISYLLLLIGGVAYVRRWPARLGRVSLAVGAAVALFVIREAVSSWGAAMASLVRAGSSGDPVWALVSAVTAIVCLGAAAAVVYTTRARQQARVSDARAHREHQRADALSEQMVRQTERERIARDMHDALAHRLSVVSLHAGALEARAGSGDETGEIARTLREQTHAALQDMRGLIGDLRGGSEGAAPASMRAIWSLLSEFRAAGAPLVAAVLLDGTGSATSQLDSAVFRIVQESLTNAVKHSPGVTIDVYVHASPASGVRIRVTNPVNLPPRAAPGGRNGLLGIHERAAALGGTAWIGPHDGMFVVDVTLPWQDGE